MLHPDANLLLQPSLHDGNAANERAVREGFEGTADSFNSVGERALNSYKALKAADWVLAASLPTEEAFEPFEGVLYRLLLWSGLGALLAAALIGWVTSRLLSPLIKLRDTIVALRGNGSQFTALAVHANDEVGQLTSAFNSLMRERLAADARLQSVVEFAPNAMVVVGVDGRIETFNREAERCFGYRRDEVLGQPLEMLVPQALRGRHAEHRRQFFAERLSAEPVILSPLAWLAAGAVLFFLMSMQMRYHQQVEEWTRQLHALQMVLATTALVDRPELSGLAPQARALHARLARSVATRLPGMAGYADWFALANVSHYFASSALVCAERDFLQRCYLACGNLDADVALARHLMQRDDWCWYLAVRSRRWIWRPSCISTRAPTSTHRVESTATHSRQLHAKAMR